MGLSGGRRANGQHGGLHGGRTDGQAARRRIRCIRRNQPAHECKRCTRVHPIDGYYRPTAIQASAHTPEPGPGQAGKDQAEQYLKLLTGHAVSIVRESGSKLVRAEPFSAQWQGLSGTSHGNVSLLPGEWNAEYLSQLEAFPDSKYKDMVDASVTAFSELESHAGVIPAKSIGGVGATSRWRI